MTRPVVLGISGSLRKESSSTAILRTLAEAAADKIDLRVHSIADVPLYNADLDGDGAPESVHLLKAAIAGAGGVILATPEYNYGMSGVLKNAIDWASRPGYASVLKGKPALVITSSPGITGGVRAQQQVRDTLAATLSRVVARPEVVIPGIYQKIAAGRLIDEPTLVFALAAIDDLVAEIALIAGR
jgi:chromate reductase, NAD(P)H dehydrogenase (quinone)